MEEILVNVTDAVAYVALNRPQNHNALTPEMILGLRQAFERMGADASIRVVVLLGRGRSFCAGADLGAMRAAADYTFEQNVADGQAIFDLMESVANCPKPIVAGVHGAAIGGGAGLAACADITIAVEGTVFAFSEVRLGIVPAVISPFVAAKMDAAAMRELFLTGERFTAERALKTGLVQHVTADQGTMEEMVRERIEFLLQGAPGAQAAVKELLREVTGRPIPDYRSYTSQLIARRRASDEGREGMSAFLQKRKPWWQQ